MESISEIENGDMIDHLAAYEIAYQCISILGSEDGIGIFLRWISDCNRGAHSNEHIRSVLTSIRDVIPSSIFLDERGRYRFIYSNVQVLIACDYKSKRFSFEALYRPNEEYEPLFSCEGNIVRDLGYIVQVWEIAHGCLPFPWITEPDVIEHISPNGKDGNVYLYDSTWTRDFTHKKRGTPRDVINRRRRRYTRRWLRRLRT